ncbi:unnamed protein product [Linum tenue]|uniref:Uncharacterized protein n=1 Tax=Linum tenue TaxID=586396 RepID=A0AAV0I7Q0_9ROSI|nr:unnamed protein product [Linum tenue]
MFFSSLNLRFLEFGELQFRFLNFSWVIEFPGKVGIFGSECGSILSTVSTTTTLMTCVPSQSKKLHIKFLAF